jgi:hypothetical protein
MYNNGNSSKNTRGENIIDGTVDTADLADGAVTDLKLNSTKLDGVEALADVTDATNISAAGGAIPVNGTWTIQVAAGGANMTMRWGYTTGYYTKIGKLVTVSISAETTSLNATTGAVTITGLPFAIDASTTATGALRLLNGSYSVGEGGMGLMYSGTTLHLYTEGVTTGTTVLTETGWTDDGGLTATFSYFTT